MSRDNRYCFFVLLLVLWLTSWSAAAQDPAPPSADSALALAIDADGQLSVGMIALSGPAIAVDLNPRDNARYARINELGMLLFVPSGGGEGVYSFAPYFDGFTTASWQENKLRVAEVAWSPNGELLAFRVDSDAPEANDGVWFWGPARDLPTDPSYHILRDCPPGCGLVTLDNARQWQSTRLEWSPNNVNIIVGLELPQEDNRSAFAVRAAYRDTETTQSRIGPTVLRYDYAHWSADGERIIVSGTDPEGAIVFGSINVDGSLSLLTSALDIGMAWVQDAVQNPTTGQLLMFGSEVGPTAPLALIDSAGTPISPPIGQTAPTRIVWNREATAALLWVGDEVFVAQINGVVTNITTLAADTPNIIWSGASLPPSARPLSVPQPIATVQPATPQAFSIGQLLEVKVPLLVLYAQPSERSAIVGTVEVGEALVVTDGPLVDVGGLTWYKVQTLDDTGWARAEIDGVPAFGPPEDPTG